MVHEQQYCKPIMVETNPQKPGNTKSHHHCLSPPLMSSITHTHTHCYSKQLNIYIRHTLCYSNQPIRICLYVIFIWRSFVLNHQLQQQVSWSTCITPAASMPNKMTHDPMPSALVSIPITIKTFPSSKATSAEAAFLICLFHFVVLQNTDDKNHTKL